MSSSHFKDEVGTLVIVNVGITVTGATVAKLLVEKPVSKEVVEWNDGLTKEGTLLKYTIKDGDLDEVGTYELQAYIEINGWKGHGEKTAFVIEEPLEVTEE
jgi:hypothetical protein